MTRLITILFTAALFIAQPAFAQTQELTREAPMGERTSMFQIHPYVSDDEKVSFAYYFLAPEKIEDGEKYPLILVLHERSGHAFGAYILADQILKKNMKAFVVMPSMPERIDNWSKKAFDGEDKRPIDHVARLVKKLIAEKQVDPARVYVTGYSMGGFGTFAMLANYPDLFAAGIPVCGGWDVPDAPKFKDKPLWVFHGVEDDNVPVQYSRDMVTAIMQAGGHPQYTEYPGVGHASWLYAYREPDIWDWLLKQSLN